TRSLCPPTPPGGGGRRRRRRGVVIQVWDSAGVGVCEEPQHTLRVPSPLWGRAREGGICPCLLSQDPPPGSRAPRANRPPPQGGGNRSEPKAICDSPVPKRARCLE